MREKLKHKNIILSAWENDPNFEVSVEQNLTLEKASSAAEGSCFSWALKKIFGGRIKER